MPISDLFNQMLSGELTVNRSYQRSSGLWPQNARSYFIDTVLNEFPFPKVVIRQVVDLKTRKTKREIIDGQQRLTTIKDYIEDKFKLSNVSKNYQGLYFTGLEDDVQSKFLGYEVSTDTIISATEEEILEIFRRINSYTLPLKDAEKRHASYQGDFKWFIKDILEEYSPMLEKYKILSLKDISRMLDAELITELCQIILDGIKTRRSQSLDKLYKDYDNYFNIKDDLKTKLTETLNFIKVDLNQVLENEVLKTYSFYSLFSALIYNRYGIANISTEDMDNIAPIKTYTTDINQSVQNILELFNAVEQRDEKSKYFGFIKASTGATTSEKNRKDRLIWLAKALQNRLSL